MIDILFAGRFQPRDDRARQAGEATAALIERHGARAFDRDPQIGHVTASGFIISQDRTKTLLMHHAKLDRWLQPGGHCDGDLDVRAVASREIREETGLRDHRLHDGTIFDIDVHEIPARNGEPAHLHHDIRFLFVADADLPLAGNHESRALKWVLRDDLELHNDAASVLIVRRAMLHPRR